MKIIEVEYAIPPLRAIYWAEYADDGQTDKEVEILFAEMHPKPKRVIRKITRSEEQDVISL